MKVQALCFSSLNINTDLRVKQLGCFIVMAKTLRSFAIPATMYRSIQCNIPNLTVHLEMSTYSQMEQRNGKTCGWLQHSITQFVGTLKKNQAEKKRKKEKKWREHSGVRFISYKTKDIHYLSQSSPIRTEDTKLLQYYLGSICLNLRIMK